MSKVVPAMPPEQYLSSSFNEVHVRQTSGVGSPMGRRQSTGAAIVAGLKNLVGRSTSRARSGSLSVPNPNHVPHGLHQSPSPVHSHHHGQHLAKKAQAQNRVYGMKKVMIKTCAVESVYDLRDEEDETDFYSDNFSFRRPRSNSSDFLILRKTSRPLSVDVVGLVDTTTDPYRQYMKALDIFELVPVGSRIITVDKNLRIDKAFEALVINNVGCALVWDGDVNKIISIVTLSDFLHTLKSLKNGRYEIPLRACGTPTGDEEEKKKSEEEEMKDQKSEATLGPVSSILPHQQLVQIPLDTKIFDACLQFNASHVHRLLVTENETGNVIHLMTLKRILQAIHKQNRSLHFAQWLSSPIKTSNVGTWVSDIISASVLDTVDDAVSKMLDNRVSGIPLVNEQGQVVNVLVKHDVARAFYEKPIKQHEELLNSPIGKLVEYREPYQVLRPHDAVGKLLDTLLSSSKVRSVFIVDSDNHPTGCVSLSDVIRHLTTDTSPFQRTTPQDRPDGLSHNPKKR